MEKKFGKPHPKLESYKEPLPMHQWLPDAFFALHRRRQMGENGYQPLTYQEMAVYAERVLRLHPGSSRLFYKTMEETDNAVLYDHYVSSNAKRQAAEEAAKKTKPKRTGKKG
ncbi:hypothetical protein uan_062 [Pseudomonas phage UAntarctica]|nr:hypothetical protein uan_062 [Pseudomonas phage UAntarctica]